MTIWRVCTTSVCHWLQDKPANLSHSYDSWGTSGRIRPSLIWFKVNKSATVFSSPEHKVLKVSYCDHPVSGVRRQSSVVCRQQFIQSTSPPKPLVQFQNNFTKMFPWSAFTKIAKMVPLRWTKWPSELKIEKPLNNISSKANGPISK